MGRRERALPAADAAPASGDRLMRGLGGSTLRGGQTVFHGLRMWGQLVQAAMMLAAFMTVALPAWNLWRSTTGAEWYAAGMYTLAEVKLVLGYEPESGQEIRFPDGTRRVMTIRDIASSVPAWEARERIKAEMFASAWLGAKAGLGVIALFLAWFWYRGVQLSRRRRIRGAELVDGQASCAAGCGPCICARATGCRAGSMSGPTASPASRIPSAPRPSTPSSRAPRAPARPC